MYIIQNLLSNIFSSYIRACNLGPDLSIKDLIAALALEDHQLNATYQSQKKEGRSFDWKLFDKSQKHKFDNYNSSYS